MNIVILVIGFTTAIFIAELWKGRAKLQSGLFKLLTVHAIFAAITITYLYIYRDVRPLTPLLFWGGAFLTWFGTRSHLESSILLRMLAILRDKPLTDKNLLEVYETYYGFDERVKDLIEAGLAEVKNGQLNLSSRGTTILKIRDFFHRIWKLS